MGASGKELKEKTHGAKFWITPVRRELLVDYDGIIGVETDNESLLNRIKKGIRGELEDSRYGLPFAGDNNLLIDRIDVLDAPEKETLWYARMMPDDAPRKGSCRLTVGIHRTDNSRTTSFLYAPLHSILPPESAWTWTPSEV